MCFQNLTELANLLLAIIILLQFLYFKGLAREHESHNYLSFGCLIVTDRKASQTTNNCDFYVLLLIF